MAFNKYGNALSLRLNVGPALSVRAGDFIVAGPAGRRGSVMAVDGINLSVLFDGDDTPSNVPLTDVQKGA